MIRYRVIDPKSVYCGQEATALNKAQVQREFGNGYGRSYAWYSNWDVLLDFEDAGIGFKFEEVEVVSRDCVLRGGCCWEGKNRRVCSSSCEQRGARELSRRWAEEDAERKVRGKYLGCPICKQAVRFTCYHDGLDYSSVELDIPPDKEPLLWEGDYA